MSNQVQLIPAGLSQNEVVKYLEGVCLKKEEQHFLREIEPGKLQSIKDAYIAQNLELIEVESEYNAIKKEFTDRLKKLRKEMQKRITTIHQKAEEVTETVFLVDDIENGVMNTIDQYGQCINVRKLTPAERQLRLK